MKKIWIGFLTCGSGHKKAAEAVYNAFRKGQGSYLFNLLGFSNPLTKSLYEEGYRVLVSFVPFLWRVAFVLSKNQVINRVILVYHRLVFRSFVERIREENPDFIITTHFFISQLVSYLKRRGHIQTRLITVITDFGVHPLWINKPTDFYIVAHQKVKKELQCNFKVKEGRIKPFGIPLREEFYKGGAEELKSKYKLPPDLFSVFLFSSSTGMGPLKKIIKFLYKRCALFIIYGQNRNIRDFLKDLKQSVFIKGFQYKEEVWELMELSNVVVTKAGGLSISECIAMKKPAIVMHCIYGQEFYNVNFLTEQGLGFYPKNVSELIGIINKMLKDQNFLEKIKDNFKGLQVLNSPEEIKKLVLGRTSDFGLRTSDGIL